MRWLIRLGATLLTGVILLGGMIVLMPKDGVARIAAERFSAATGRAITISGDLRPRLWPVLGLRSGPVEVANADWGNAPWLLRAEAMDIGLDLSELLGGRIRVTGFILSAPDLVLERAQDGRVNWALGPAPEATETSPDSAASPLPFVLERANIRDGRLRILDHGDDTEVVIEDLRIDTAIPDLQGPVELQASGSHNGQTATLKARIADLAAFIEGDPVGLDLDLASGAATFGFAGEADLAPLAAEGSVTADLTDVASLAQLIGQPAPQLPEGWGQDSLTLTAAARLTADGGLHLRDALLSADGQTVVGTVDWTPRAARPHLAAMLSTGLIRLTPAGEGRSADLTQTGWSETPFDLGLLSALDADITLATEGFDFGRGALGPSTVRIALDSSRAVFTLEDATAYGGKVAGTFVLNNRKGLSVGGDLTLSQMAMQPLFANLAGFDRLTGTGDLQVKFLGIGNSMADIMASLSGDAQVTVGKGEILGLDIAGMLRTMDPGHIGTGKATLFDSLTFGLAIRDGVARNDDLAIDGDLFRSTGAGEVDIGRQQITYRLMPRLLPRTDGSGGVEVPVLISGPWAAPGVKLDLEWLAKTRAEQELARTEELARQKLEALARDDLGIQPLQGETLEDAAKRQAEEALRREAERLLGIPAN